MSTAQTKLAIIALSILLPTPLLADNRSSAKESSASSAKSIMEIVAEDKETNRWLHQQFTMLKGSCQSIKLIWEPRSGTGKVEKSHIEGEQLNDVLNKLASINTWYIRQPIKSERVTPGGADHIEFYDAKGKRLYSLRCDPLHTYMWMDKDKTLRSILDILQ